MKLTDVAVRNAEPRERPYKLHDKEGDGLYLLVHPSGAKCWRVDYPFCGKRRTAALGVYRPAGTDEAPKERMPLTDARKKATELRQLVRDRKDPAAERKGEAAAKALEVAGTQAALREEKAAKRERRRAEAAKCAADRATVRRMADAWVQASEKGWTVDHAHQVRQSLDDHVHPAIGGKPITDVGTADVLAILTTLLDAGKVETASRVYQRLPAAWEWAILHKHTIADPVKPLGR